MRCQFGPFQFDAANAQLWHGDKPLKVRPKSFDVLAHLVAHAGELVSPDDLLDAVWGEMVVGPEVVKTSIRELRQVLGETAREPHYIATVHRRGYRFIAAVTAVESVTATLSDIPADGPAPLPEPLDVSLESEPISEQPTAPEREAVVQSPSLMQGERRQLTILFCDLLDSPALSDQLDPEDLSDILKRYYDLCGDAIALFEGYIAQYQGDRLLVYFGYPQAHEDAARRAVYTGLEIIRAVPHLNRQLDAVHGIQLSVRIGIHTGPVMVDPSRGEDDSEPLVVGASLQIASRIQTVATPETVWITDATYPLIQGYFHIEDMGRHHLSGGSEPVRLYCVIEATRSQHRLDVVAPGRLTPFVGREMERLSLQQHWEHVKHGQGRVVVVSGEAGMGKSRLVRSVVEGVSSEPHLLLEGHCSPYHQHTAFYPLVDLLQRHLQLNAYGSVIDPVAQLAQLAHDCQLDSTQSIPLLAALLGLQLSPDQYPDLELSPVQQRQRTLETLLNFVLALSQDQPIFFFIEDGHWLDPSTLEWLNLLVDQGPTARILTIITTRPGFSVSWYDRAHVTTLTLSQLSAAQMAEMVQSIDGTEAVAREFIDQIVSTTDGVPLFVEEVTRLIIESRSADRHGADPTAASPAAGMAIPATLHDLLTARLDALGAVKRTAQLGATIGREFSYELLQAVSPLGETSLRRDLELLLTSDLLYQRGLGPRTTYQFKHALVQEAAYRSQLRRTRQQQHLRIAQILERSVQTPQDGELELVAYHYTEAGAVAEAIPYWLRAGERSAQRSAHSEAVAQLKQGIELLQALPESPDRSRQELNFYVALGSSLYTLKGFADPEVEHIHLRARTLCHELGDTDHLFLVLRGLVLCYVTQGLPKSAEELASELLELAEQQPDIGPKMLGHYSLTIVLFVRGQVQDAIRHGEQVIALYQSPDHDDLVHLYGINMSAAVRSFMALALWLRGYPDQALEHAQAAVHRAQQLGHPFTLVTAKTWLAWLHQFRHEPAAVYASATESNEVADKRGFALYAACNRTWQGWALMAQGQSARGLELMREAMTFTPAKGTEFVGPYLIALIAEAVAQEGDWQEGEDLLTEVLARVNVMEDHWWESELHRMKGELLLRQCGDQSALASDCFTRALDIARSQNAKSLELRAATSLAQLWQSQRKLDEARDLLTPIYSWFTEGFDTADLQASRRLLDELS